MSKDEFRAIDYVETTMAQPGELNTYMIACAIFFHVETEPMCWTAFGNAWGRSWRRRGCRSATRN